MAMLVAGCGSDPGFNEAADFAPKEGAVQFVNMIADSPELTMLHGLNQQETVGFPFSSGVQVRVEDRYDWRIAYRDSNNNEVTIDEADDQPVSENVISTFLMMGTLSQPNIQVVDVALPPVEDRPENASDIWFAANLSNVAMVDIYYTDLDASLEDAPPLTTIDGVGFSTALSVEPGDSKQIRVTTSGTTDVLFDSGGITIIDRSVDLFALVDDFGPGGASHIDVIRGNSALRTTIADVSQPTEARVANYSSITELDLGIGTTQYTAVTHVRTPYLSVPHGTQELTVSESGTSLGTDNGVLAAGEYHTLLVFDSAAEDTQVSATLIQDRFRPFRDRTYFQFVNGGNEAIDFYALTNEQDTDNTAPIFNDTDNIVSGIFEVPLGATRFIVTSSDNSQTHASIELDIVEGITYTAIYEANGGLRVLQD